MLEHMSAEDAEMWTAKLDAPIPGMDADDDDWSGASVITENSISF